jgi:glutamine amidotransferase
MCRLFGLSAAPRRVHATFWLLEAPDSLSRQSRREPDGTGLGTFATDGTPEVDKRPLAAYRDRQFAEEAKQCRSVTFIAHIRYASTGALERRNTHPFEQQGRLFAHNGVIGDLPTLEAELAGHRSLVAGDTDSERFFALITKHIDARGPHHADRAVGVPLPGNARVARLQRTAGGPHGDRHLDHASSTGRIRTRSGQLARFPAVVVASERMDEDPGWQELRPGELLHVDGDLSVTRRIVVDHPPRHQLSLAELGTHAAASQK